LFFLLRLKQLRAAGETDEQDVEAILDQIKSVKTHSERVLQWLSQQRAILEEDIERYDDVRAKRSVDITVWSEGNTFPIQSSASGAKTFLASCW